MEPAHGYWCGAKTWPTKCPEYDIKVFFFKCNCGSKVFFDQLGEPWPIHDCATSWTRNLIRVKDKSGGITVQLSEGVTMYRPSESFRVDKKIISLGERLQSQSKPDPIVAVSPENCTNPITVIGILREKTNEANVKKILRLKELTGMASGFLVPLGQGKWGKVTIHEPTENKTFSSYTVWVEKEQLTKSSNTKGVTVCANIKPYPIPNHGSVWIFTKYEVLG